MHQKILEEVAARAVDVSRRYMDPAERVIQIDEFTGDDLFSTLFRGVGEDLGVKLFNKQVLVMDIRGRLRDRRHWDSAFDTENSNPTAFRTVISLGKTTTFHRGKGPSVLDVAGALGRPDAAVVVGGPRLMGGDGSGIPAEGEERLLHQAATSSGSDPSTGISIIFDVKRSDAEEKHLDSGTIAEATASALKQTFGSTHGIEESGAGHAASTISRLLDDKSLPLSRNTHIASSGGAAGGVIGGAAISKKTVAAAVADADAEPTNDAKRKKAARMTKGLAGKANGKGGPAKGTLEGKMQQCGNCGLFGHSRKSCTNETATPAQRKKIKADYQLAGVQTPAKKAKKAPAAAKKPAATERDAGCFMDESNEEHFMDES